MTLPKVLAFDVFGTVVDWRTSIARESAPYLGRLNRPDLDPHRFADAWRRRYVPAMEAVTKGECGFVILDTLHREMLEDLLRRYDIDPKSLEEATLTDWSHAWRRLDPWPDAVPGLTRLKRRFPIVTLSNGNIALMLEMARRGGLPWDAIMGAEVTQAYKPDPAAYTRMADILQIARSELCLVAAHHSDLGAARRCGLATAFIHRPMEYGGRAAPDVDQAQDWDYAADSLEQLAQMMDC